MITGQKLYGGARITDAPSLRNIEIIDLGAMPMISAFQENGLQVDLSHFARMEKELVNDMARITETVRNLTGYYINMDSGDQVSDLLFKKIGLKQARPVLTTSGARESVEDSVLIAIQHDHPVVPLCLEYKEYSKLLGTYVRPMPKLAKRTAFGIWRMYPQIGHTRVPSGRLNCREPNLLAMPTRTERGRDIRKGFITADGWVYVSVDFSQIEPRIAAHRSLDPGLLKVYRNDEDIYSDYAISAFKLEDGRYRDDKGTWKYPHVNKDEHRRPCKTCVLAALYGVTAGGLLEQMPIVCANCEKEAKLHDCDRFRSLWTEPGCQDLLNSFFLKYPGIIKMMTMDHRRARDKGMVWDIFGRILHVAAVQSVLEWVVSAALRECANFGMQSSAQGCIKLAMAAIMDDLERDEMLDLVHPLLQIHDELLLETREDLAEELGRLIANRFETCVRLEVPIKSSVAIAQSWGTLPK